uniref:Uncharacterized protein n=1 Tax=Globisporangium ultimum (strain ATCC 200006 / CBS 805.95 / DAOM BR144) TaxID=431595 RepID=K3WR02_GLOUD
MLWKHSQLIKTENWLTLFLKKFLSANGVSMMMTNAYTPTQQYSSDDEMLSVLWNEAFRFVVDVMNITPTTALNGDSLCKKLFDADPDVSRLRA